MYLKAYFISINVLPANFGFSSLLRMTQKCTTFFTDTNILFFLFSSLFTIFFREKSNFSVKKKCKYNVRKIENLTKLLYPKN